MQHRPPDSAVLPDLTPAAAASNTIHTTEPVGCTIVFGVEPMASTHPLPARSHAALVLACVLIAGCPDEPEPVDKPRPVDDTAPLEDTACEAALLCPDGDGDGYGAATGCQDHCGSPAGWVADSSDCDDSDPAVHPGADELCDDVDQDCDGRVDEEPLDGSTWFADTDADGYGSAEVSQVACDTPGDGWLADAGDCDDADAALNPAATETCDGVDNDCDALVDEDDPSLQGQWFMDLDGDGYGDPDNDYCSWREGSVEVAGDCDDDDDAINPDADDRDDDGVDDDCDGFVDGFMSLADADAAFYGEVGGSQAGVSVADAGDVDGDGVSDILVGAPAYPSLSTSHGMVYLVSGSPGMVTGGVQWLADATARLEGSAAGDYAGGVVSGAGDVDGDGFDDFLVGAPAYGTGIDSDAGAVFLFCGPVSGDGVMDDADAVLIGESIGDGAGISASSGDFDGDGVPDVLVGSYYNDALALLGGAAHVVYGPITGGTHSLSDAGARLMGPRPLDYAGFTVAGVGDTNADGMDDMLVGGNGAWLVYGPPMGDLNLDDADGVLTRESPGDDGGNSLAGAGDVNADGYDDFLVGAHSDSTYGSYTGAAYLLYGPVSGQMSLGQADAKFTGESAGSYAGRVGGGDDFDQDGFDDVLITAYWEPSRDEQWGAVYVVLGPVSGNMGLEDSYLKMMGEHEYSMAGKSVDYVDDLDGDGFPEVLIGAHWASSPDVWSGVGAAYLVRGR